ncbi:MAG: G5 domain-containing protein [Eubacteriaceae bacterium]|jgi:uncharacterized protein YabE (DUF348 family)
MNPKVLNERTGMDFYRKAITIFKENKKRAAVICAMVLFVAAAGFTCAFNLSRDVKVTVDKSVASGQPETQTLSSVNLNQTVGEVLDKNNISTDGYTVSVNLSDSIRDVDEISLKANAKGNIEVDGTTIAYDEAADTVGDLLTAKGVSVGADDIVTPSKDTPLTTDITNITVDRVEVKQEQRQEEIPFETQETEDANVDAGTTEVDTQGQNGIKTITENVKYMNGVRIGADTVSEELNQAPVAQVQRKGTKTAAAAASTTTDSSSSSSDSAAVASSSGNAVNASSSDFDTICAIVAHEGGTSYDGACAVMSAVMNRYDAGYASSPLGVLTAPGQFSSYLDGYYTDYLGSAPAAVQQAVTDCLNGYRMHPYKNFRSYQTSGSTYIVNQWFFN